MLLDAAAVQESFGDQLRDVQQVASALNPTATSVDAIEAHLTAIQGAIQAYGGSVKVLSATTGLCRLNYNGPEAIALGIQASIKDKFPDIATVELV